MHSGRPPHLLSRKTTVPSSPSASSPGPGTPVNTCKQTALAYRNRRIALFKFLPHSQGPSSDSLNWAPGKKPAVSESLQPLVCLIKKCLARESNTFEANRIRVVFITAVQRKSHLLLQLLANHPWLDATSCRGWTSASLTIFPYCENSTFERFPINNMPGLSTIPAGVEKSSPTWNSVTTDSLDHTPFGWLHRVCEKVCDTHRY